MIQAVYERLLTYDYLARPVRLIPGTADALPEITDGGKTYTLHVRKGIYFQPDPAFKGARRELTAGDYAYSIKRFVDPAIHSPWKFLVEGKIVGLDALANKAGAGKRFDYDAKVSGLEVVDRYTLRIHLNATDYNFAYILAMPQLSAVAREVIEAYADDTNAHPVGTGPYVLASWARKSKIVLEANPGYRKVIWDFVGSDAPRDKAAIAAMKGKSIPQIGRVEISIIEEDQSRWLAFQRGEIDYIDRFQSFAPIAIPDNKLAPDLAARGIGWDRSVEPEIIYYFFNMKDPVVGGYTKERIALRRAIAIAYDTAEEIRVIRKGQAIADERPVPPGVVGYNPAYRSLLRYDPVLANQLLDYFGYKKGADGYRNDPSGKRLTIVLTSEPLAIMPGIRRIVEKGAGRHRPALRDAQGSIFGQHQGGRGVPARDVGLVLGCGLSRRRELHAALLRAQHPPEQPRVLRICGIRPAVRADEGDAGIAGARSALRQVESPAGGRRRAEDGRIALS